MKRLKRIVENNDNALLTFISDFKKYISKLTVLEDQLESAFDRENIKYEITDVQFKPFGVGYKFTFRILSDAELPNSYVKRLRLKPEITHGYDFDSVVQQDFSISFL